MREFYKDTRAILAYFWSVISAGLIFYITVTFGSRVEILTLILGFISGGIVGTILPTYFSATNHKPIGTGTTTTETETNSTTTEKQVL